MLSISDEKLQETVRRKLLGTQPKTEAKQKAVHISQVAKYSAEDWEYVATLPDKHVVIKLSQQQNKP